MLKFNRVVCVLAIGLIVTAALGAAVKIKWFYTYEPNPDADGMAMLNYVQGQDETIVQIVVSDFEAYRDCTLPECADGTVAYTVKLVGSAAGTCTFGRSLVTNQHGHGTFHSTVPYPGDYSDADVEIYLGAELRAEGFNPG
jgi:hypothetical protein